MKWRTKDGRVLDIKDMGDEHLLNAHRMLRRKVVEYKEIEKMYLHPIFGPQGEMAQECLEQGMEEKFEVYIQMLGAVGTMDKEIKKRDLTEKLVEGPKPLPKIKSVEHMPGGGIIVELDIHNNQSLPDFID